MTFGPIEIAFDDGVLEPRPWTLAQSRWAVELLAGLPDGPVLELCAGVGQIGLVVAVESGRAVVQVDANPVACSLARRNATAAGVAAEIRLGDLEHTVAADERFPLVVADPPYIEADRVAELPDDPVHAIDGGADGLALARTCLRVAAAHLVPGGLLLLQLGGGQQAKKLEVECPDLGFEVLEHRTYGETRSISLLRRVGGAEPSPGR